MESRSRYLADVILCYAVISYVIELFFLLLSLSSLVYHILLTADISPFLSLHIAYLRPCFLNKQKMGRPAPTWDRFEHGTFPIILNRSIDSNRFEKDDTLILFQ